MYSVSCFYCAFIVFELREQRPKRLLVFPPFVLPLVFYCLFASFTLFLVPLMALQPLVPPSFLSFIGATALVFALVKGPEIGWGAQSRFVRSFCQPSSFSP